MEIILKEGEEVKIKAEKGNLEQYRIIICHQNCILTKQEVGAITKTHITKDG